MSLNEFYSTTWYEWNLCVERITEIEERRRDEFELMFEVARQALAKYFNWHRGDLASIAPQEVWPMRYDTPSTATPVTDTEPTREEKIKAINEVAERVKKKRRG